MSNDYQLDLFSSVAEDKNISSVCKTIDNNEIEKNSIDELFSDILSFKSSEEYVKFLEFLTKFRHYSHFNNMLVYLQNKNVTFYGSASYWRKKFKRTIKSTAKQLIILAPMQPIIIVFDIYDTESIEKINGIEKETAQQLLDKLSGDIHQVKGNFNEKIYDDLCSVMTKNFEYNITLKPLPYLHSGSIYAFDRTIKEIELNSNLDKKSLFSTLCHELAHLFLGHTQQEFLFDIVNKKKYRIEKRNALSLTHREIEAETVCYLVCERLNIKPRSAGYIADYIKDDSDLKKISYDLMIKTAKKILDLPSLNIKTI